MAYSIKAGDVNPPLDMFLTDQDGKAIDLTGCTVRVTIASKPNVPPIVSGEATILDPKAGKIRYIWSQGETDRPGIYLVEAIIRDENGDETTVPASSYGMISIHPRLQKPFPLF